MPDTMESQYLTFDIDGDIYGIPVTRVREVLEYTKPTKLPKAATFLKGLINIRNVGIPVVDLRVKFGLPEREITKDTAILVVEVESGSGQNLIGAIADAVYEVIELDETQLESPPRIGMKIDMNLIQNVGKREDQFIIIVDMDQAFSDEETQGIRGAVTLSKGSS